MCCSDWKWLIIVSHSLAGVKIRYIAIIVVVFWCVLVFDVFHHLLWCHSVHHCVVGKVTLTRRTKTMFLHLCRPLFVIFLQCMEQITHFRGTRECESMERMMGISHRDLLTNQANLCETVPFHIGFVVGHFPSLRRTDINSFRYGPSATCFPTLTLRSYVVLVSSLMHSKLRVLSSNMFYPVCAGTTPLLEFSSHGHD